MGLGIALAERSLLPDVSVRFGIRSLLKKRLNELDAISRPDSDKEFSQKLSRMAIAHNTIEANQQHYELPARFFELALGKHLKYSGCYYENGAKGLDQAEADMLELYFERAKIKDGQSILELGCGWGSLTLWLAEKCPNAKITGVSNSRGQKDYILKEAKKRGLTNVTIITCDMNSFHTAEKFDRIVSIEMFEHMRNLKKLFGKVRSWLRDDGLCFIHVFSHKSTPYFFETEGDDNWMGRYFFTGGVMPSHGLYAQYEDLLKIQKQWIVGGQNYAKTANDWLKNMDEHKEEISRLFMETYGAKNAAIWQQRWRIFFMSCAELFGYKNGSEWDICHILFSKP